MNKEKFTRAGFEPATSGPLVVRIVMEVENVSTSMVLYSTH